MNVHEALALLELPSSANAEQVRAKVREQYRLWSNRVSTAPTVAGRQEAERRVELLDQARQVLEARDRTPRSQPNGPTPSPWTNPTPAPLPTNPLPPPPSQPQAHYPPAQTPFPQPQVPHGWYVDGTNNWRCTTHQTLNCSGCYFPGRLPVVAVGPPKSRAAAGILGLFLGSLGVHRFYLGYSGIGVIMLLLTVLSCLSPRTWWGLGPP